LLSTLDSKISQIYVKPHSWHSRQLLPPMWCVPPYWHCIRLIQSNNLIRLDYGNHVMAGQSTCEWISTRTASKERSTVIIWHREPAQRYHTVLKASPGAAIFGRDMLFDIPFIADWKQLENIGYTRQIAVTNVKTAHVLTTITQSVTKY
jgi:hypothetical protein